MIWVLGFVFSSSFSDVLLLRKNRGPAFNIGRLNGIGGKIEADEDAITAMQREGREESGIESHIDWRPVCIIHTEGGDVHVFTAVSNSIYGFSQKENELLGIYNVSKPTEMNYLNHKPAENLRWLIPMSLNILQDREGAKGFEIKEIY